MVLAVAESFLQPMGPVAEAQRDHLVSVVLLTLIALVPALVAIPVILWRYRRGNRRAAYRPEWSSNRVLECFMWGVPMVVIALIGTRLWRLTHRLDPYREMQRDPLDIQVVGLDWKWLFLYPKQGVAMVDELVVPTHRAVRLKLTTDTVMQSFRISALAGQIYAMPGMVTELNFAADREGLARGMNTQFSGTEFWKQKFLVRAVSPEAFADEMRNLPEDAVTLDGAAYATLARRGTGDRSRFRLPDDGLFSRIVERYQSATALTEELQPGSYGYRPERASLPSKKARPVTDDD